MTTSKDGDLRVWWIPQIGGPTFHVDVETPEEGALLCEVLANYDLFQLANNIKPDYSNAGGLSRYADGEWDDWFCDETDEEFDEFLARFLDERNTRMR